MRKNGGRGEGGRESGYMLIASFTRGASAWERRSSGQTNTAEEMCG